MTGKGKVVAVLASLAIPGTENVYNAFDEYMKAKEMTPEQLKEVLRLRERLDKVFSVGEELLKTAIDERGRSETIKKLTLMLTMNTFASIRQDYDELDFVQPQVGSNLEFMREWKEKYEVETKTIELAMKNIVTNANEEFLERTVWQESNIKLKLETKDEIQIQSHIVQLLNDDKKENDKDKRCAVRGLRDLARQSHSSREYIAKQGAIGPLIDLLKNGTPFLKQDAACALGNLAFENDSNCEKIVRNGGIELLNNLLNGTEAQPEYSAYALGRIVNSATIGMIVGQNDMFERLIDLLVGETSQQRWAAGFALGRISKQSHDGCAKIVRCGGIPVFVGLLQKSEPLETAYAAHALGNLAADNFQIAFDVIPAISILVQMVSGEDTLQVEFAAYALSQLAFNRVCGSRIDSMDAIPPLVLLLDGSDKQRLHAARTLAWLAEHSIESCKNIAVTGGIGPLSGLLNKPEEEQLLATRALGCIAQIDEATRREIIRHGVIDRFFDFLKIEALVKPAAFALSNISILLGDWGQSDTKKNVDTVINLIKRDDEDIKEYAAAILRPLCSGPHNVKPACGTLLAMITSGSEKQKINASSVFAKRVLTCENHQSMASEGFVKPFVNLLSSWSDAQKDNALLVISKLASSSMVNVADVMAKAHVVMPLRNLIIDGSEKQATTAVRVLLNLLTNDDCDVIYKEIAREFGTYRALQHVCGNGTAHQQDLASRVVTLFDNRLEAKREYFNRKWDHKYCNGLDPDDNDPGNKVQEVFETMNLNGYFPG